MFLSETVEGTLHDKALADEMELYFPPEGVMMQDLGFMGYSPDKVKVVMPEKKPNKQELSSEDKAFNMLLSSMRVTPGRRAVEHAIAGIKRLKILQEKIRLSIEDIQDQVMSIACGLHNLRFNYINLP